MLTKKRWFPSRSVSRFRVHQNTETFSKLFWLEEGPDITRDTITRLIHPYLFAPDSNPSSGHFVIISLHPRQPRLVYFAKEQLQETDADHNHTLPPDPQLRWAHICPLASFHAPFRVFLSQVQQYWRRGSHYGSDLIQVDPLRGEWGLHSRSVVHSKSRS